MRNRILYGWNFMRVLRLVLGVAVIVQGITSHDWTFAAIGALLAAMPVLNIGCCGSVGYCAAPRRRTTQQPKDVSYEEIH